MKRTIAALFATTFAFATPALADFQRIDNRADFVSAVYGKTLTRPLVKLQVLSNGQISGKGARWAITGNWEWKGGYLCRSLNWGGDDLGYNCQEIKVNGSKIRITSDRGAGQSADFRMR